jgi:two-component system, NtrC family, nitrogen regulation response regulator NtrX
VPLARVLVVDDELQMLAMVTEVLTLAGYEVVTAATASEAFVVVAGLAPDVILLDIAMPGIDGLTTLQRLRELTPNVPVVMLTGNTDEEVGRTALRWGAFDYVRKPFSAARLEKVVAAAIGHRRG